MRRLVAFVIVVTLAPVSAAWATELDELLERGQQASYTAEQVISCSTPDGDRNALVRIAQSGDELRVTSNMGDEVEVVAGEGDWALSGSSGLIAGATVDNGTDQALREGEEAAQPLYIVDELGEVDFLGRDAMAYRLMRDDEPRAILVFDDETGAIVQATTLNADGEVYCERRFVSLDESPPDLSDREKLSDEDAPTSIEDSNLPANVAGFARLDHYEDDDGVRFAYYSDGFFSFALFETPGPVTVPDPVRVEFEPGTYSRAFTAGQVLYSWETADGGMALVGDVPPDLHEAVLSEFPHPDNPGLFRRWWRALFG